MEMFTTATKTIEMADGDRVKLAIGISEITEADGGYRFATRDLGGTVNRYRTGSGGRGLWLEARAYDNSISHRQISGTADFALTGNRRTDRRRIINRLTW